MTRPKSPPEPRLLGVMFADEPSEMAELIKDRILLLMINDWMDVLYPYCSIRG